MPIPIGKIPPDILSRAVLSRLGRRRSDVLVHARLGEDCAIVDFGDDVCVVSSDPITGASRRAGWLAVHVACNDVAASGAEPVGILVTLLFPEGTEEEAVRSTMTEVHQAAMDLGIEVLGGHSEITAGIPRLILMLTAIGRAPRHRYVTSAGARDGHDIVLTKGAAIEGTAILAHDFFSLLSARLPLDVLQRARGLYDLLSVVPESRIASARGASAMHDVTEGGVIGAIYELAEASGVGVDVWAERIPVRPETDAICRAVEADPLRLVGSGGLLIVIPDGAGLVQALREAGIAAAVIGKVRGGPDASRLLHRQGTDIELMPPERDELWRILEKYGEPAVPCG